MPQNTASTTTTDAHPELTRRRKQRPTVPRITRIPRAGDGRGRTGEQGSHGPAIITRRNRRSGAPTPVRPGSRAPATVDHAMRDPDEFDQFYKDVRTRLLLLTYCLTGDLPSSRAAVRDSFVVAWHHWRKVSRVEDPEAWV